MSKQYYTPNTTKPQTASVGDFRAVRLESDAIIQRVSKDLYASPASGVRELLANEIRAAIKAKEQGANPRIEVTIKDGMVRVWGIDSLGMERDIFDTVYMTLGRSSNFDGKTPGQFGLGRAAYVTISDHMLLETNCRNGDCYSVLGVDGRGYQTGLPEPDIPYGTRVTMAPRDRPNDAMLSIVYKTAKRSPIPITVITGSETERLEREPLADGDDCITADLPDVEFAINPFKWGPTRSYLCGIPIDFRYSGRYHIHNLGIDIHDERKFPPTPDRERMTEKAEKDISEIIDAEIDRRLAGFPRDLADALDHPDLPLARRLLADSPVIQALTARVPVYGSRNTKLVDIEGRPILNCHNFNTRQINAVSKVHPNAAFVKGADGLPYITTFMKENGIKGEPTKGAAPKSVAIHHYYGAPTRIDPQNPPEGMTIYRVAGGSDLYNHPILQNHDSALTIHDVKGAVDIDDAMNDARERAYQTSRGLMTGGEILDGGETVYPVNNPSLVECWGEGPVEGEPTIAILMTSPREFAELQCQSNNIKDRLYVDRLGGSEELVECFIRLETPAYRRLLLNSHDNHKFRDDFLAAESGTGGEQAGGEQEDGEPAGGDKTKPALARTFKTSRGDMTGQEMVDSRLTTYPVEEQSLADCWGDGPEAGEKSVAVVVGEPGSGADNDYDKLSKASRWMEDSLWFSGLGGDEDVIETYLRLENPLHKRVLRESFENHKFGADLMRVEGKEPVPFR